MLQIATVSIQNRISYKGLPLEEWRKEIWSRISLAYKIIHFIIRSSVLFGFQPRAEITFEFLKRDSEI